MIKGRRARIIVIVLVVVAVGYLGRLSVSASERSGGPSGTTQPASTTRPTGSTSQPPGSTVTTVTTPKPPPARHLLKDAFISPAGMPPEAINELLELRPGSRREDHLHRSQLGGLRAVRSRRSGGIRLPRFVRLRRAPSQDEDPVPARRAFPTGRGIRASPTTPRRPGWHRSRPTSWLDGSTSWATSPAISAAASPTTRSGTNRTSPRSSTHSRILPSTATFSRPVTRPSRLPLRRPWSCSQA